MSKPQTRRSLSLKGSLYARLKEHCETEKRSMSDYVEEILNERLEQEGVPVPVLPEPPVVRKPLPANPKKPPESGFTF